MHRLNTQAHAENACCMDAMHTYMFPGMSLVLGIFGHLD